MGTLDENGDFVVDEEEHCEYIAKTLNRDQDTISTVLDPEMAFLESKGLVLDEKPSDADSDGPEARISPDELMSMWYLKLG